MYTIFACKGVELLVDLKLIHSKIVKSCEKNRSLDFDYAVIRTLFLVLPYLSLVLLASSPLGELFF